MIRVRFLLKSGRSPWWWRSTHLWNVGPLQRDYTALHTRKIYKPQDCTGVRVNGAFLLWFCKRMYLYLAVNVICNDCLPICLLMITITLKMLWQLQQNCHFSLGIMMMEAVRTSETSVDNHFTRHYIPEDNSEHCTRRRENLKSRDVIEVECVNVLR
jgi:hypothetical protein